MKDIRPRQVIHTGFVFASGLALDLQIVPETLARKRIAGFQQLGSDAFQTGTVLILRFRTPALLSCAAALGAPLVRYGKLLSACPLTSGEISALESNEEAFVLVSGGTAALKPLCDCIPVDISQWLDASEFTVLPALRPLGAVAMEPLSQLAAMEVDVRRALGVAPLDAKAAKLLQALRDRNAANAAKRSAASAPERFSRLWARLLSFTSRILGAPRAQAGKKPAAAMPAQAAAESRRGRMRRTFREYFARALWSSKFGHLLGRQYGKYFSRLLDMFDENDLERALRHAISLDGELSPGRGQLPLWTPSPRADLSIGTAKRAAGSELGLGDELYNILRERYRRAFARLEAQGEIEKAAFVLAELLNASSEAVSFLEKHGRFTLAAEIAEARNLPPGLVIRLWFLAGERERAIRIARRTGAFSDAVIRLESSHKKEAEVLRLLWAHTLAESGQYAGAVDVAWPIEEARNLVFAWIDKAIGIGGASGARMLAHKALAQPQPFPELRESVLRFLQDNDRGAEALFRIFGQELMAAPSLTDETKLLARATARRFLPLARDGEGFRFVQKLVAVSGDTILRADLKGRAIEQAKETSQSEAPLLQRREPLNIYRAANDCGTIAIFDAAQLPDGKTLLAAGELGALLVSREGTILMRFSEPASRIVMSDNGDRAILLARRGEIYRLTRIDLVSKRQRPWCDARFDVFAPDFDGLTWFVARGGALYAIDALAERWEQLWKVDETSATITSVRRNSSSVGAFFKWQGRNAEAWTYDYPSLMLRQRREINQGEGHFTAECVSASGDFAGWRLYNGIFAAYLNIDSGWVTLPLTASGHTNAYCLTKDWIVQSSSDGRMSTVYLLDYTHRQVRARISFEGAELCIAARIQDAKLTICDDRARVLVLDLDSGAIVREHRIS